MSRMIDVYDCILFSREFHDDVSSYFSSDDVSMTMTRARSFLSFLSPHSSSFLPTVYPSRDDQRINEQRIALESDLTFDFRVRTLLLTRRIGSRAVPKKERRGQRKVPETRHVTSKFYFARFRDSPRGFANPSADDLWEVSRPADGAIIFRRARANVLSIGVCLKLKLTRKSAREHTHRTRLVGDLDSYEPTNK